MSSEGLSAGEGEDGDIAVVFGATGGIGRSLLRSLEESGDFAQVRGFSRRSDPSLDLMDETGIAAIAHRLAGLQGTLRLCIDATGMLHDETGMPEKGWAAIDPGHMARSFRINAVGPALLMKHILPLLPRKGRAVFATLSARVGSIGDNELGGWYSYRASKAALNQLVRTASIELKRQRPEAICVALHPGTVTTPMSEPFLKQGLDVRSPEVAAADLMAVIGGLTPDASGGFFDHKGSSVPW